MAKAKTYVHRLHIVCIINSNRLGAQWDAITLFSNAKSYLFIGSSYKQIYGYSKISFKLDRSNLDVLLQCVTAQVVVDHQNVDVYYKKIKIAGVYIFKLRESVCFSSATGCACQTNGIKLI